MELSKILFATLKEVPKDAEVASHKLMLRAGYIRQTASGVYTYLPFGLKLIENIRKIIKEEMDNIGGQELLLPVLTPKEIWEETNRWNDFGDGMFRVKDRKGREFALSPTHEEIITDLARREIKSYKELPQIWYQIQTKFRDEQRPRSGLLRVRQFEMKDSYSLDIDYDSLNIAYEKHREAYIRIFKRCGLDFVIVKAASGLMGGRKSEEFMAPSVSGEDNIIICANCKNAMNSEVARPKLNYSDGDKDSLEEIHTPVEGTIDAISNFLNIDKKFLFKSILFIVKSEPMFVIIPGDRDIDEDKLALIWGEKFRYANDEEIIKYTGSVKGYISPLNLNIKVVSDFALKGKKGYTSGANKKDYHLSGINIERDIKEISFADIIKIQENDKCIECGGNLESKKTIEIGHIFQLGTKYSESMNATYLDSAGERKPIVMGSYGIGLGRIASTVIEQYNDKDGIKWPISVSPFKVIIVPVNYGDENIKKASLNLYNKLREQKTDVLIDDRDISAGMKFKDADLIGVPFKIIFGKFYLSDGNIEVVRRMDNYKENVSEDKILEYINKMIKEESDKYNV